MKGYRSALLAGLLGLAVAVCDDEGTVTQPPPTVNVAPPNVEVNIPPTPPAPPVVAPLTAMITPASSEVSIGGMVDFAVGTTGGSGDASWTCTSSDAAVATVEKTDTGCRATAVAGGGATITAAVTKGSETTNVAATLTVSTTADAFLIVTNVSGEYDSDASGLKGTVDVDVSVERGNQSFERLSLNVDGMEVDAQDFGSAAAADDAEQSVHEFTLSFNSAGYEEHGDHTDVDYMNGEHSIQATLKIAGRDELLMSNILPVEFDNDDGYVVTADLGDNSMLADDGKRWYGGPANGHIVISALPVSYSGEETGAVTIGLAYCDAEEYEGDDHGNGDDHGHGYGGSAFEFDCKGQSADREITVSEGGEPAKILNEDDLPTVNIDMAGPDAPHFNADPNGREGGWINQAVLVATAAGPYHASRNKDGWLVYNDDEEGVGGYYPQVRYSSTTPSIVDGAREATPNVPPTGPTRANAMCVIATAVDRLGNESGLPSAGSGCVMAADYAGTEDDDGNTTYPAGIRAGLDVSAPTIKFSPASPRANASSLKEFQVEVADAGATSTGRSGLHSEPVLAKIELRDADNDIICGDDDDAGGAAGKEEINGDCVLAGGLDFSDPLATTDGLNDASEAGYYTFTAMSQDKAGNMSEMVTRTAVNDGTAPDLGLIVGGYSRGAWSLTATLTDNLSIKSYWAEARDEITGVGTGNITILPREGGVPVDEYNSAEFTQSHLTTFTMQVFRALQPAGTGETADATLAADATLDTIKVVGTDHGGGNDEASIGSLGSAANLARFGMGTARTLTTLTGEPGDADAQTLQETAAEEWNDNEAAGGAAIRYARNQVFQDFVVEDEEDDADALELRATIRGTAGYVRAVAGVADNTGTDVDEGKDAVSGVEGLVSNPVSRVDFYAAVVLDNVGATTNDQVPPKPDGPADQATGNEALVFLGSSSAAGAEDYQCAADDRLAPEAGDTAVDCRKYTWGLDMSGADFVEKAGGEGNYTIVAIAVNSAGVAIATTATEMVED